MFLGVVLKCYFGLKNIDNFLMLFYSCNVLMLKKKIIGDCVSGDENLKVNVTCNMLLFFCQMFF